MQLIIYSLSIIGAIISIDASTIPTNFNNIVPLDISLIPMDLGQIPQEKIPIANRNRYALETYNNNLEISLLPSGSPSQNPSKGPEQDMGWDISLLPSEGPSQNPSKGPKQDMGWDISLLPIEGLSQNPSKGPEQDIGEDMSLLPMNPKNNPSKDPQRVFEQLSLIGFKQEEIEEVVKLCGTDLEAIESDLYTCAIRTVTSFITCMQKDGFKEPTQPAPILKCLSEAVSVFVKCLLSKPSSIILDSVPEFAIQNT